ncbi:chalcone isomerase family protein [Vibrio sp. B1Z05]|uniref:chalcone isomerase family protein n=1 Tax=Vibrio sp. B1Z05 TaxID=2654980 RepID=UPI0020A65CC3|nr:chalcone isomerase family protein [Vibrio sp. B1Z05]
MRLTLARTLFCISLELASTVSFATPSKSTLQQWQQWPTVGSADLDFMFFDVYTSQLRSPEGQYQVGNDLSPHPVALAITYERNISKKHLLKETKKQWEHLGYNTNQSSEWLVRLGNIYPDVALGDQLVYITDGLSGAFVYIQKDGLTQWRGEITDEALNDAFLAIWLSPNTEYPKHRQQLIGLN